MFSNVPIRRVLNVATQYYCYRTIKYAKYTVERNDRLIYTFTDVDFVNLCAYDLPHLHGYLQVGMESRRDYATFFRRVVHVMREHIKYNRRTDFQIRLQLSFEKVSLPKPEYTYLEMERWVTNSVITRPVLRFVYMDDEVENKIFRLEDAAKYSDDTLTRISSTIEQLKEVNLYRMNL